jgi:predicted permease
MLTPPDDPVLLDLRFNRRLWAVGISLTLAVSALFGVAPAVRASHTAPITSLKTGARAGMRAALMRPFVAVQVAFSLAVLFVGGLLVLSFARLSNVPPGFATSDVLLLSVETVRQADQTEQRAELVRLLDRLRTVPGVEAASSAEFNVLGRPWTYNVKAAEGERTIESSIAPVMPGFFETMRISAVTGRTFTDRDGEPDAPGVIVVNETFAREYFGRERAIGRTIAARFGQSSDDSGVYEVVGVVADLRYDLREAPTPTVYILMPLRWNGTIHVRTSDDAASLAPRLREEVRRAGPLFRVTTLTTQSAVLEQTLLRERLLAILSGFFSVVGLILATVGLYGVLSYGVEQRTREIGIRMALGSPRLGVLKTIVADAAMTTLVGAAFGLAAGLYLSRFVESLLFDVRPLDAWSLAVPAALLALAALVACALPAWRAARVDPVVALRFD